jgi:hypothetical protein
MVLQTMSRTFTKHSMHDAPCERKSRLRVKLAERSRYWTTPW